MVNDNASDRVRLHLETLIAASTPGDRLPSVRSLMSGLGVSPTTVRRAVSDLVRSGRVEAIPGSGTFVAARRSTLPSRADLGWQTIALGSSPVVDDLLGPLRSSVHGDTIDLASGYPDPSLHPTSLLVRATAEASRRPGAFGRSPIEGIGPLREWFSSQLTPASIHEVLITPGGQSALFLAFRSLAMAGDPIVMETPTYIGAIAAARASGLVPVPTPIDTDGVLVDGLEATVRASGARLVYLQPLFHNPTGATLSQPRRAALMDLAKRYDLIIVEDEWLRDLGGPNAPDSLASIDPDGHVVNVRSLTKSVAPALRIGAISAVGPISRRIRSTRGVEDIFVSTVLQESALSVVTSAAWRRHLRTLRDRLAERQIVLDEELSRLGWTDKATGGPLHRWVELPPELDPDTVTGLALRRGVSIISGTQWHPADATANNIRLSNASASPDQISEGMSRLAEVIAEGFGGR